MLETVVTVSRRLFAAQRAARYVRASGRLEPTAALEFARETTWYGDSLRPTQATHEVLWLMELLRQDPPHTILEIGTDRGGTMYLWSRVAAPDALCVAVDSRRPGRLGRWSPFPLVRHAMMLDDQRLRLVMPANSHDPNTVARVRAALDGRQVDFLFIDGDHSYEGVKQDYEMFSPLVRPGGLVAFHDIAAPLAPGVSQFWSEFKRDHETDERIDDLPVTYGIGISYIPTA